MFVIREVWTYDSINDWYVIHINKYMNDSLEQYMNDGNFNVFSRSLEMVIKSCNSISSFCEKAGIDRAMFYDIFAGKQVSRVDTLAIKF